MKKFMGLMNSSWVLDGHDIVTAFNLSCFQRIVDLGGKTSVLARCTPYLPPLLFLTKHVCKQFALTE